jgi:hypothetical protein
MDLRCYGRWDLEQARRRDPHDLCLDIDEGTGQIG